jgi:hypothetical protein
MERGEYEINAGRKKAYDHHYQEILQGVADQAGVVYAETETYPDDRTHQRGDEHSTDDYRGGVDVEANGCYNDGKSENPYIRTSEENVPPDALLGSRRIKLVTYIRRVEQIFPEILPE